MGRRKSYDRDVLIGQAVEIFRDHGYAGTSTQMLVDQLGVNRFSLYAEFGNKQGLFEAALERYDDDVVDRRYGPLEDPEAGVAEVRALLDFYASPEAAPADGRGCLLCNTAVEFGPADPSGEEFVRRYFDRLSTAFHNALANAKGRGELRPDVDPRNEAAFFTSSVLGLYVMFRASAPQAVVRAAAATATEHLDQLCAEPES